MRWLQRYNSPKMMVFADQAVVSGSSFITNILVARSLGAANYGKFSVFVLIQLFLMSLQQAVSSGIYQVMYVRQDAAKQKSYTNGLFYLQTIVYAILLGTGTCFYLLYPSGYHGYEMLFWPALLGIVLFLMQDFLRKVLLTVQGEKKALGIDIITNLLQIGLLAGYAFSGKLTLALACWIIALTFIPSIVAGVFWIRPGFLSITNMRNAARIHGKQSGWMLLSALLQWFAGNFFIVAAGVWLGVAALGALRLAQYIFGLLNVLLQAIENYALPKASQIQHSVEGFHALLKRVFGKSILMIGPALILLSVFAKPLLRLAGGNTYLEYSYVMHGLSLVYVFILIGLPLRIALRVRLLNQNYFIGYLLAAAFSMAASKWMIREWQLVGVLSGLLITQIIVNTYWFFTLNRKKIITWKLYTSY